LVIQLQGGSAYADDERSPLHRADVVNGLPLDVCCLVGTQTQSPITVSNLDHSLEHSIELLALVVIVRSDVTIAPKAEEAHAELWRLDVRQHLIVSHVLHSCLPSWPRQYLLALLSVLPSSIVSRRWSLGDAGYTAS
jgi:hypothetical protein